MSLADPNNVTIQTGAFITASTGLNASMNSSASLLRSSFPDILAGNYTLYLSDVLSVAGFCLSLGGFVLAIMRMQKNKK